MATILLTDGQQRKTLSAARALGKAGHKVLVAEVTRFATARFSRYVAKGLVCPDPAARPEAFWHWLCQTIEQERVDAVLPMDDHTTSLIVQRRADLPATALVPTERQFTVGNDKGATVALARQAGVRVPLTLELGQAGWAAPDRWAEQIAVSIGKWPVVLKARHGSGGRGLFVCADVASLRRAYINVYQTDPSPLLQEYIPQGRKFDVCLLFSERGTLVASFVQEELRGYPLWGGPSTLQESVWRPDLVDLAVRLLKPIGWKGPVEVEFLEDPRTDRPVLMEINPRMWASLDLAVTCGVDFPVLTAELSLGIESSTPVNYPLGRRCRWLLPGDLLHFLANPQRFRMDPPLLHRDDRTHDDLLSWHDPLPTLGFILACLRYCLDLRMWRMIVR